MVLLAPVSGFAAATAPPIEGPAPARAAAPAETRALSLLLERAATLAPGTYLVSGDTLVPSLDPLSLFVQADTVPGDNGRLRGAIALGGQLSRPARTRVRIVTRGVRPPTVVSDYSGSAAAGTLRAQELVAVPPGEYDVQAAIAQRGAGAGILAAFATSRLVVPEVGKGPLALGPLVLGDAVSAAGAAERHHPFTFGPTVLRPAASRRFAQAGDVHVAVRAFNWTAREGRPPDLRVEYVFYERTERGPVFFNKVKPRALNGDTLGAGFETTRGAVNTGMSIPLSAFPFGDFELTVRVTDERTRQTASQSSSFSVVP